MQDASLVQVGKASGNLQRCVEDGTHTNWCFVTAVSPKIPPSNGILELKKMSVTFQPCRQLPAAEKPLARARIQPICAVAALDLNSILHTFTVPSYVRSLHNQALRSLCMAQTVVSAKTGANKVKALSQGLEHCRDVEDSRSGVTAPLCHSGSSWPVR